MRIGIVGAGMAGLACAEALTSAGHAVVVLDKGRGPGGRMSTRRLETPLGEVRFDHGAQYFTGRDPGFRARVAAWIAAGIAALCGTLIGSLTTISFDSGFIISLKGFVAAIAAGLTSYPLTVIAALFVGLLESFSAFYASAFKEVIVFSLIIPLLVWRSFVVIHHDEEE